MLRAGGDFTAGNGETSCHLALCIAVDQLGFGGRRSGRQPTARALHVPMRVARRHARVKLTVPLLVLIHTLFPQAAVL